jgi:hypothetical protein
MEEYDKTRIIRRPTIQTPPPPPIPGREEPSPTLSTPARAEQLPPPPIPGHAENPDKTRILPRRPGELTEAKEIAPLPQPPSEGDKTILMAPPMRESAAGESPLDPCLLDPIVGWLVVIAGPGRGHVLNLGVGMNSIGRAEDQRCRLDFGDTEVSRKVHATLTYDPRGHKFYLMHGGGQNLTYLGETPVLAPMVLAGGELIALGKTTLKFIPLCGADFDWSKDLK